MSFSDFGRHALPAFSATPDSNDINNNNNNNNKSAAHRRRSDGGAILVSNANSASSSSIIHPHRASSESRLEDWKADGKRGVRPRLDHLQCPVTQKTLLHGHNNNDASLASTSISTNTMTTHDEEEDEDEGEYYSSNECDNDDEEDDIELNENRRTDRRKRRTPKHYQDKPMSSKTDQNTSTATLANSQGLYTQIARFQKMVSELESISRNSNSSGNNNNNGNNASSSPEAAWKSRILLRSAQDAERDLGSRLSLLLSSSQQRGTTGGEGGTGGAFAVRNKKLARDFRRARDQLQTVVAEMERRQRADVSFLTAAAPAARTGTQQMTEETAETLPASDNKNYTATTTTGAALHREEDFFDRAMRERNHEVKRISNSMKMVHEIYQDLAGLVDGQQEQIDQLEDLNENTKAETRAGLEEIQHGMWKLCAADRSSGVALLDLSDEEPGEGHGDSGGKRRESASQSKSKPLDPGELLTCMMCHHPPQTDSSSHHVRSFDVNTIANASANAKSGAGGGKSSSSSRQRPFRLPSGFSESAQDVYQRGHAMVGGIVEQVHEAVAVAVATNNPGSSNLREVLRDRITCTPRPGDYDGKKYYFDDVNDINDNVNDNVNDDNDQDANGQIAEPSSNHDHHQDDSTTDGSLIGKTYFQIEEHASDRSPRTKRRSRSSGSGIEEHASDRSPRTKSSGGRHERNRSHRKSNTRRDSSTHDRDHDHDHEREKHERRHRRKSSSRSSGRNHR
eukprot:jgi/Psemu1/5410/gm1.5410_g